MSKGKMPQPWPMLMEMNFKEGRERWKHMNMEIQTQRMF